MFLEAIQIVNNRNNRLVKLFENVRYDYSHITSWHISTGDHFCEISFHNMENSNISRPNEMIQKYMNKMPLEDKTDITFGFLKLLPFNKIDICVSQNVNSREIAHRLDILKNNFLCDLNSLSEDVTVKIDRVYKIDQLSSELIGYPLPETKFTRIRVNIKAYQISYPEPYPHSDDSLTCASPAQDYNY